MVSIVVPVYNVELYIEKCLDSVINQTYRNKEIIVINDGSTDGSGDICEIWAKKHQFTYISKNNEGLGLTRNLGIKVAKGDYILFVDSDDWLATDAVEKMVECLRKEKLADVVSLSRYYKYDDKTRELVEIRQNELIGTETLTDDLRRRKYLLYGFVMVWGKLFRKNFLLKNNIFMPAIPHEDNAVYPEIVFRAE